MSKNQALNIFFRRVLRSIKVRSSRLLLRCKYISGISRSSNLSLRIYPRSVLAAIPGSQQALPLGNSWQDDKEMRGLVEEVMRHRFRIFTEELLDVSIDDTGQRTLISTHCQGVNHDFLASYQPIDWHRDFHSGYRWSPSHFYQDVRIAPASGVDIKVPRELSRFQHVWLLAYGDQKKASIEFMLQVTDWIVSNPFDRGVNWECSMDIALRAINWIWGLRLFEAELMNYPDFQKLIANSLRDHGRHVYENLDYYGKDIQTSNHYLAEIAGLIYIGAALPTLPEADLWLAFGIQELVSEMEREVLEDGVCHEASTSYHRLVTELFVSSAALIERLPTDRRQRLTSVNIKLHRVKPPLKIISDNQCNLTETGQILPAWFYARLELMAEFSLAIRKPNGLVYQIGDNDSARVHKLFSNQPEDTLDHDHLFSTIGELVGRYDLIRAGSSAVSEGKLVCGGLNVVAEHQIKGEVARSEIKLFSNAGIAVHVKDNAWLGVSCGPSCGHGHNDKNSFELTINKQDFVVDGGCPAYTYAPEIRNKFRSTAMHSTIYVANLEQNIWPKGTSGLFSLPENAAPNLKVKNESIVGIHHGYGTAHKRIFSLLEKSLIIEDVFMEDRERYLVFNLHPNVVPVPISSESNALSFQLQHCDGTSLSLVIRGGASFEVLPGAFSLGYMRPMENKRLCIRLSAYQVESVFNW